MAPKQRLEVRQLPVAIFTFGSILAPLAGNPGFSASSADVPPSVATRTATTIYSPPLPSPTERE